MHIMDILQNSTRAKANNITLEVLENHDADTLTLIFKDDGCGMSAETVEKVINPFFTTRTTRKVGLGLPLLKQNTEQTGGSMKIESELGVGTTVTAIFGLTHLDRPPMGDLAETVLMLFNYPGEFDLTFTHRKGTEEYSISRLELADAVGGLESIEGISLAREFLQSQESSLC